MAAGLVAHTFTTASGETFTALSWVPNTGAPDVDAKPISVLFDTGGNEVLTAAQVVSLLGYLDGVEGKLDTLHTDLDTTLKGYLDGLEGYVDGLETLIGATNAALGGTVATAGNVAHDAADSGNPGKVGYKAIAHGANPTAVAADDRTHGYANRHGIPWVIGGHPNVITRSATIDAADGAQTNASLLTISSGNKIVVTSISATASASNSGSVAVRIGFGTATLGAASEAGTDGILLEGKFPAGGGHQRGNGAGILGVGADNEDLRVTCDSPTGGSLFVTFSYYTVES